MKTLTYVSLAMLCCMGMLSAADRQMHKDPRELQEAFKMIDSVSKAYNMPYYDKLIAYLHDHDNIPKGKERVALLLADGLRAQKELLTIGIPRRIQTWRRTGDFDDLRPFEETLVPLEFAGFKTVDRLLKKSSNLLNKTQIQWIKTNNQLLDAADLLIGTYIIQSYEEEKK